MISRQRRQRRRAPPYATTSLTGLASSIGFVILLQSSFLVAWIGRHGHGLLFVSAHGYLKSPRSRNLVAFQDKNWETFLGGAGGSNDPFPEDCPHCLNRGGKLAQCGILTGVHDVDGEEVRWERNYDRPLNVRSEPMSPNIQGEYREGDEIEVEVFVTTHHKGHFEFSVCPISDSVPMEVPTEECFAKNKLEFISDELYNAPIDTNYPHRAYIAPASKADWSQGVELYAASYKMKFRLPMGVSGDLVLLQWYYLTANSCKHEGYADYPFPEEWGFDVSLYPNLPDCGDVPEDGNGVPEQFWNCAEIKVVKADDKVPTSVSDPNVSEGWDVAASKESCADDTYNYSEAIEDCAGYTYCMMGKPTRTKYCREGMLYDQTEQKCKHADEVACGGRPVQESDTDGLDSTGSDQSIGVSSLPEDEQLSTSDTTLAISEIQGSFSSDIFTDLMNALKSVKDDIDTKIFLYQTPDFQWVPSTVYRYEDFSESLDVMATEGVAGKTFYIGESAVDNGHSYGLVNIAAFLAQSMKETIQYDACDENSWDFVGERYPLSNACGQLGQSYQDYHCSPEEAHMECEADPDMSLVGVTHAKWYGAPGPLYCGPKTEEQPHSGFWDHAYECDKGWADPPEICDVYEGQKAGRYDQSAPVANSAGRTDVEGCCWWGRGVIQTSGICNFGKLNYFLGAGANKGGRPSRYPQVDFCKDPEVICASSEHSELKWIAGEFYWLESVQSYNKGGWDYITELRKFVDNGMTGTSFIDGVSGIVNRGCHNPPCGTGDLDGGSERAQNFQKVLDVFFGGADRADALVNASELPVIESMETDDYNSELLPSPMPTYMDYDESMQPTTVSSGSHQDADIKGYYLDPFTGACNLNDGSRPTWIETVFSEYDECCELSWNKECLALNPIDEETYNPSNKPTFTPSRKIRPTSGESLSASSYTEISLTTPDYERPTRPVVDAHGNPSQNQIQQQPSYIVIPSSSAVVVEYGNRPYKGKEQKNPEQEIAASVEIQIQKQKQKLKNNKRGKAKKKRGKAKKKRQQSLRGRGGGGSSNGGAPVRPSQ